MKPARWMPLIVLALAAAAAVTGLVLTREPAAETAAAPAPGKPKRHEPLVDERPLQTARRMEPLATSPEEKRFAHQALRLGNHEVDLAFTDALRRAVENPPELTPQAKELLAHKTREEAAVKADTERVAQLTRQAAAAPDREQEALATQLGVAKAQLELDQDELDQAAEDLERAGGDPQAPIRRLQEAHAALDVVPPAAAAAAEAAPDGSLVSQVRTWSRLRAKALQLAEARREAQDKAQNMTERRAARAARVEQEKQDRERTKQTAAGMAQGRRQPGDQVAKQAASDTLAALKHYTEDQRMLADSGRRITDLKELAEVYGDWGALVAVRQRAALHTVILWLSAILLVLGLVVAADRLFEHLFLTLIRSNKRVGRMLKLVKYAVLAAGIVVILVVVFGMPSQVATLFGLAGAGLTVALKDFIVAFFGWFVLVGRNGLHVGDWVEINGVGGEVVEIGLLKTMLLETGDWNDSGHPTGRIVSFVNSFAMEGHFFNFSTSGQWMWDEIQLLAPAGTDPYPLVEAIRLRVEQETEANAKLAEQEWRQSAKARHVQGFSARPGINLVPAAAGVEIRIRYITRAYERHQTRRVLNQAVVELLSGRTAEPAAALPPG